MSAQSRLETVFKAFVDGMDGLVLSDGSVLSCAGKWLRIDALSDQKLPFLHLKTGSFQANEWTRFEYQIIWDIEAELKVKAPEGEAGRVLRSIVDDIFAQVSRLRGLYVDDQYNVYSYSQKAVIAWRKGLLTPLAFRGGPFLRSFRVRPTDESSYSIADLVFRVEFIDDFDPEIAPPGVQPSDDSYTPSVPITSFSVGATPRASDESFPLADPYTDFMNQIPPPSNPQDVRRQGLMSGPDVLLPAGDTRDSPPFPSGGILGVKDVRYGTLTKEIGVLPAAPLVPVTTTVQMFSIRYAIDGSSDEITARTTWSTGNPAIATISASGLVTGVTAGTTTITSTYGGSSKTVNVTVQ